MVKSVYLDQNMWITLLRQEKGQRSDFEDELDNVKELSESGEVVFPLSRQHAVETASYWKNRGVDDMFEFMLEISRQYCIAPFDIVEKEEILQEAHRLAGLEFSMEEKVIGQGLPFMHAGSRYSVDVDSEDNSSEINSSELGELLHEYSESEEFAEEILADEGYRGTVGDRSHEQEIAENLEEIREENEGKFRSNSHQRKMTTLYYFQENVRPAVYREFTKLLLSDRDVSPMFDHGISEETLESEEYMLEYVKKFPAIYTYTKLTVSRDLEKKKIEQTDLNDIMSLSVAIPYCDLVLTENFWAKVSDQCDVDDEYNCVVSSDLSEVTGVV